MNNRLLVFVFLAVFLLPSAFAIISSQRASDYVAKENYFLYDNEQVQIFPTVKIRNSAQYYWMVAVSSGEAPVAYIPVLDKKEISVPDSATVQRALFKTADVMWFISKFKERLSSQDQWFFSTTNASFFSNLSMVLKNEPFELESIKSDLKDSKADLEVISMNSSLVSMSLKADSLSAAINSAITTEQDFFNDPDTNRLNYLRDSYDSAFTLAKGISEEIIQYNASVVRLKDIISKASIDASKKNQLLSFANPPSELQQVSSKVIVSDSVKQAIDSAYNSSITRSKDLVDNLALRMKKNKAAMQIYLEDPDFRQKTSSQFSSLEQAAGILLSSDYVSLWKNQEKLSSFSDNYSQAKSLYGKGDFDLSLTYSAKAKSDAVLVLRDGYKETQNPGIDWTLWIYFAIILVIFIAVVFALRNRKKFSALIQEQGNTEGEEVKLHAWERRP